MKQPPETLIQFSLEKMRQKLYTQQQKGYTGPIRSGLIYAGNIHDAIPRQLLLDSRLSPVDKLAWMMIRLHAQQNEGAIFPTYDELQLQLATPHSHKASRETISRALLMLRLTGWLSLCNRVRDSKGRVRGNIYMQHDEPLNAYDAETFDPCWLDLVEKSSQHKNKSVRCVARATIQMLKNDPSMRHQHTRVTLIEQRMEAIQTPEQLANRQRLIIEPEKNRTQSKKPGSKIELSTKKNENTPSSKIELSAQTQSGSTVRKSNHYVRNSFTQGVNNTYVSSDNENLSTIPTSSSLRLPDKWFMEKDREMLEHQLRALPEDIANAIIDQLRDGVNTGTVRNPVAYALNLLKSARDGRYNTVSRPAKTRTSAPVIVDNPSESPKEETVQNPESRGPAASPESVRQHILNIRRNIYNAMNNGRP